jgi:hypothetical protein
MEIVQTLRPERGRPTLYGQKVLEVVRALTGLSYSCASLAVFPALKSFAWLLCWI